MHSKEQNLNCPGCGKHFTRAGGLVNHVEFEGCIAVRTADFEMARKKKEQANAAINAAHNFQDFSRSGALGEGPNPFANSAAFRQQPQNQQPNAGVPAQPQPVFNGDNLIGSLDVLNLPWGPEEEVLRNFTSPADFPALNGQAPNFMDSRIAGPVPGSAWAVNRNLFPAVPLATPPPPAAPSGLGAMVRNSAVAESDAEHPNWDPDSPDFNARNFWIGLIGKYKCPWPGCG